MKAIDEVAHDDSITSVHLMDIANRRHGLKVALDSGLNSAIIGLNSLMPTVAMKAARIVLMNDLEGYRQPRGPSGSPTMEMGPRTRGLSHGHWTIPSNTAHTTIPIRSRAKSRAAWTHTHRRPALKAMDIPDRHFMVTTATYLNTVSITFQSSQGVEACVVTDLCPRIGAVLLVIPGGVLEITGYTARDGNR